MSIDLLKLRGLDIPMRLDRTAKMNYITICKRQTLNIKVTNYRMEKAYHLNAHQKNAEVTILKSDKIGFKTRNSTRERKTFHNGRSQYIR